MLQSRTQGVWAAEVEQERPEDGLRQMGAGPGHQASGAGAAHGAEMLRSFNSPMAAY